MSGRAKGVMSMKRIVGGIALALVAMSTATASNLNPVPEMDGGFALVVGAIVMGIGAVVYEKYFRK